MQSLHYLHAFERGSEAKAGIGKWLAYYNGERPQRLFRMSRNSNRVAFTKHSFRIPTSMCDFAPAANVRFLLTIPFHNKFHLRTFQTRC